MKTIEVDKSQWRPFFDRLSRQHLQGKRAEVEVASLDLGDQIEAEWLPLMGITYDPNDDIVEVALDGTVDHLINKPRKIFLAEDGGAIVSIEIVDADGTNQIVKLKDPLMLPPPQTG